MLAETLVIDRTLVEVDRNEHTALCKMLPVLRKTAAYLEATHQTNIAPISGSGYLSGWSSDRTRRKGQVETWITAMVVRFYFRLWLAERAALRGIALKKLDQGEFRMRDVTVDRAESDWRGMVEQDNVVKPVRRIYDCYIKPIFSQKRKGFILQRPAESATSFIIFGPPGSGKTYFVDQLAKCLNWPLVSLSPGHFIRHGLEAIESTSRDIFECLSVIDHAVVFFDECDELFRERNDNANSYRSILSFATASMLPKLQELHDEGRVLFVVGTNYLRTIDPAIRRPGRFDDLFLFDRPDDAARRELLKEISEKENVDESHVNATAGLTFKELMKYRKAMREKTAAPGETSLRDYQDWCMKDGEAELDSCRLSEDEKGRILKRWAPFMVTTKKSPL